MKERRDDGRRQDDPLKAEDQWEEEEDLLLSLSVSLKMSWQKKKVLFLHDDEEKSSPSSFSPRLLWVSCEENAAELDELLGHV